MTPNSPDAREIISSRAADAQCRVRVRILDAEMTDSWQSEIRPPRRGPASRLDGVRRNTEDANHNASPHTMHQPWKITLGDILALALAAGVLVFSLNGEIGSVSAASVLDAARSVLSTQLATSDADGRSREALAKRSAVPAMPSPSPSPSLR